MIAAVLALVLGSAQTGQDFPAADPMGAPCRWGEDKAPSKTATALTLGYIYGHIEGAGPAAGPTGLDQPALADAIAALCARNPQWTLRAIAAQILKDKGVGAPGNGTR